MVSTVSASDVVLAQQFRQISDEDKSRFLVEIRQMVIDAREAQDKTPKFALMLLDRNPQDLTTITQLISMVSRLRLSILSRSDVVSQYMFIFTTLQQAEAGRFPCPPSDRDPLQATLGKLNGFYKQMMSTPEGYAYLQRIFAVLDQPPMPPPDPALIPRLRAEDLKSPPAKRSKAKPSGTSPVSTVEPTPPVQDAEKLVTPIGAKRKRESTSQNQDTKVRELVGSIAERNPPAPRNPAAPKSLPAQATSMENALGINPDAEQAEAAEHAPFFASYNALRSGSGWANREATDIWSALTTALDEYQSVQGQGGEDELFAEFIDVSKVDSEVPGGEYQPQATPELFGSHEEGEGEPESDLSPESVKTVASGLGRTPGDTAAGMNAKAVGQVEGDGGGGTTVLGLGDSPTSVAFNGMLFGGWEDETFDFGATT